MGIVIDLKDMNVRTPEQVLRVFYQMYTPGNVELELWKIFTGFSTNTELQKFVPGFSEEKAAVLFDQLIALVRAVDALQEKPPSRCPLCGREENLKDSTG